MKIRTVIIGYGKYGCKRVSAIERLTEQFDLLGVMDKNFSLKDKIIKKHQVAFLESFDELVELKPELVIISVPNNMHNEYIEQCNEHGFHVLCEKPLANKLREINYSSELKFKLGSNLMFFDSYTELGDQLHNVGNIKEIDIEVGHNGQSTLDCWNSEQEISGGGTLIDNGVHALIYICSLLGMNLTIDDVKLKFHKEIDTHAIVTFMQNGIKVNLVSSWEKKVEGYSSVVVRGTNGMLSCDAFDDHIIFNNGENNRKIKCKKKEDSIISELRYLYDGLKSNIRLFPCLSDARKIQQLIENIYKFNRLS